VKILTITSDKYGSRATVELDYADLRFLKATMALFSRPYARGSVALDIYRSGHNKVTAARIEAQCATIIDACTSGELA
jgi:hypothetical protein